MVKALLMVVLGIALGCVGSDPISGTPRLTYGIKPLLDGFDMVPVVMGLFGISEVLFNLEQQEQRDVYETKIKGLLPNREDSKRSLAPIPRGSILGFFIGVIPGGTAVISSFVSYAIEKRLSKHPEGFGKDRRGRRSRGCQQCGNLRLHGPPAHPGYPLERGDGPVPGGPDDPRTEPRHAHPEPATFSGG